MIIPDRNEDQNDLMRTSLYVEKNNEENKEMSKKNHWNRRNREELDKLW